MAKITSAKTVIDNNKLFTSQINDDNTRQFNEYDITLQDIQTKQLDFTVDVTPIDDKLEKLTVSFDGDKFIGMDIRNREVYNFQATTPYNLDVSNQIGTFERPVRKIVLLGPDDGLRVPTVNPTLEWRADSSAEGYRVEVSANGFVSNVYSAEVSGTTHTVSSNLAFDTTYEWRVAGTNKGGVGEYSDPRSFITRIGNTGAVTLLTPTNGDDIVNVTPTFSWSADANAVSYQIQISTNNFASTVIDTTTFNTNFSTTLVHDQTYQWRVRAINEFSTSVWSTVWTFQVESNVVGNVSLSSPSNGQTGVSIPTTLSWGGATNATSYDVQVSTNNFVSFVYNDNTTSTSVSIPGLGFNTDYQWRVRGVNRTNVGNFASRSFETRIGDVGSLTLTAPSNGQTISSTSQTFTWNPVTNATIYDIQISTNNFASYIVNTSTSSTSYSYSPFSLGTTYQWRVRARNAYSTGGYVSRSFSVFSPSLSLSRSSASFGDNGGSVTFSVTSNTTWLVTENTSWISVTGGSGSGNDSSVTINVTSNGSTSSRSGTVTVQTTDGSVARTISVNQAGQPAPTATPTPTPVPTATPTPVPTATPTPVPDVNVNYVVVAGGGGGGIGANRGRGGGGGGAGAMKTGNITFDVGLSFPVTVGAGGTNGGALSTARNGTNSQLHVIYANGGGGGGRANDPTNERDGANGGNGGGGSANDQGTSTVSFGGSGNSGNDGGDAVTWLYNTGGGGGGAGSAGANSTSTSVNTGGTGGNGLISAITGSSIEYAKGGNGGRLNILATNGLQNRGNGGDGGEALACSSCNTGRISGLGGSGIIVLRYPSTYTIDEIGSGLIYSTSTIATEKVTIITGGAGFLRFT